MGQTDKQFSGFLRIIIRILKETLEMDDMEKMKKKLRALLDDLQTTLED